MAGDRPGGTDGNETHGTPEAIAFLLMERIARHEAGDKERKRREYRLDLYAECLQAARGERPPTGSRTE